MSNKVKGQASMFVELEDGKIRVKHGTDKTVLADWVAKDGDWDILWQVINSLKAGNDIEIKEF